MNILNTKILRSALAIAAPLVVVAPLAADTLYVSSDFSHEVLRYDPDTGALIDVFISAGSGGLDQPHAIIEREFDVIVCSFGTDQVLRYDRDTGAFLGVLIDSATGLDSPVYMIERGNGDLLISSQASDELLLFASDGTPLGALISAGLGGLSGPSGFAIGPDGRLYVAGRFSGNVIAYDAGTGAFDELLLDTTDGLDAGTTFGMQFAGDGAMYLSSGGAVRRYNVMTDTVETITPFAFPIGLEVDDAGDIVVASSNNLFTLDTDMGDAVAGPQLTGGAINLLNFFHFARDAHDFCAGDCNNSGAVDFNDLVAMLFEFGESTPLCDTDASGTVEFNDLIAALFLFGQCE